MGISPTGMIKSLGWGRFFQLLVHLPSFLKLFAQLVKDPRVNIAPKLVILGVLAYVVLPTDLVPDFIPGLGYADDLAVLLAGLKLFLRLCPPEVVQVRVPIQIDIHSASKSAPVPIEIGTCSDANRHTLFRVS